MKYSSFIFIKNRETREIYCVHHVSNRCGVPGGTSEPEDDQSGKAIMLREFLEETGNEVPPCELGLYTQTTPTCVCTFYYTTLSPDECSKLYVGDSPDAKEIRVYWHRITLKTERVRAHIMAAFRVIYHTGIVVRLPGVPHEGIHPVVEHTV